MKQMLRFLSALIILTMACAVPGLSTDAPQSLPTPDTRLENMVALTVSAALELTANANQNLPVITLTQSPVQTNESTPTPEAATAIPVQPLIFSAYGTAVQELGNAGTLFIDRTAGYQFMVTPEWTVIRPNEPEYFELWLSPVNEHPYMKEILDTMQKMDPKIFRVFGFNLSENLMREDFVVNFDIRLVETLNESYQDILKQQEEDYPDSSESYTVTILNSEVTSTLEGIEIGIIEVDISRLSTENNINVYEKQVFLKIQSGGYLAIRFDTPREFKEETLVEFDQIINSIKPYLP